jgi:hypothetical protein
MVKKVLKFIYFSAVIVLLIFVFQLATFSLFDNDIQKIELVTVPEKNYQIELFYSPADATVQSIIGVWIVSDTGKTILKTFERYNFIKQYNISSDTLQLLLCDSAFLERGVDTFFIQLP